VAFVTVKVSQLFDRSRVIKRVEDKKRRALSGTGAYTRQIVRRSMRSGGKKGAISQPGQPPRYHARGVASLKDGIFFGYEKRTDSVVIGPRLLNAKGGGKNFSQTYKLTGAKTIPELLERGGIKTITGRGRVGTRNRVRYTQPIRMTYRKRPYMTPALPAAANKLADLVGSLNL
jgi:hypothetical protein